MENLEAIQENSEVQDRVQPEDKEFHPQAEALIEQLTNEFSEWIRSQARILADQWQDEVVLTRHVKNALEIWHRERQENSSKEWTKILGGALFGISGSGFIQQFAAGPTLLIGVYAILGVFAAILIFRHQG